MRRAARVDNNQLEIVRELSQVPGVSIIVIGKPVDLLVGFRARNYLFEIKRPDKIKRKSSYTAAQRKFIPSWNGQVRVVSSSDEIIRTITNSYREDDRHDYQSLNLPDDMLEALDTIPLVEGSIDTLEIRPSSIHGQGLFTNTAIRAGDFIAPAVEAGQWMNYSRYCNHAQFPNATCIHLDALNCNIIAVRDIHPDEEITVDYRANLIHLDHDQPPSTPHEHSPASHP